MHTTHVVAREMELEEVGEKNFLQSFWSLSSEDERERNSAAKDVLTALKESQEQSKEDVGSIVTYALQRLVKGLASNRKGARHGFYVAFTELLVEFPDVPLSRVFELINTHLVNTHGFKGQEERGAYFGRVFASLAVIQSGRLVETNDIVTVAKHLSTCGQSKFYLGEVCAVGVGQLVEQYCSTDVSKDHVIPLLGVDGGWDSCTPERLYTMLHLNKLYGKERWFKDLVKTHWNCKHISSHRNIHKMITPLLESTSAHPRLHSVWPLVLDLVRFNGHFQSFWKTVVDDSLFTSSHERKFAGFLLLESLLPLLTVSEIPVLFSTNLVRCLVNNATAASNYLHSAAKHLLFSLSEYLQTSDDQKLKIALLLHLQRETGGKFDQLTGTSISDDILSTLDVNGVNQLLEYLMDLFCNPALLVDNSGSDDSSTDGHSVQLWCLDQILLVVRNRRLPHSDALLLNTGKFLLFHAFFTVKQHSDKLEQLDCKLTTAPLEVSVREQCAQKFTSVLTDLSTISLKYGDSTIGHPGLMENGEHFLTALTAYAKDILALEEAVQLAQPFTDMVSEAWKTVSSVVEELVAKESLSNEEKSFHLIFSATALQLLVPENRNKMAESIQELKTCYNEMVTSQSSKFKTPKKRSKKAPQTSDESSSQLSWIEVLTDMLLSFLSQPSQLWRGVVEQVFRHVTNHVTSKCLHLILGVLEPEQTSEELMEDSSLEQEEVAESDDSAASGDESDKDNDDDKMSSSGDDSEAGEGVDPAFRAEIEAALGETVVKSDAESESSLDDDAMMAVDDALAAAFRNRFTLKHQKKQKKEIEKSVIHFKLRVLDLVETFIRKESSNLLVLDLVVPLYELVFSSQSRRDSAPIADRTTRLLKSRLCHAKEYPKVGLDVEYVHSQLSKLTQYLYKANANTAQLLTQTCMFLIRVLRGSNATPTISPLTTRSGRKRKERANQPPPDGLLNVAMVTEWFGDALVDFLTKKNSSVPPLFFTTYIQRYPNLAVLLLPKILQHLSTSANHYRKTQGYEMLHQLKALQEHHDDVTEHLSTEDRDILVAMATKTKKRKHSKHNKTN